MSEVAISPWVPSTGPIVPPAGARLLDAEAGFAEVAAAFDRAAAGNASLRVMPQLRGRRSGILPLSRDHPTPDQAAKCRFYDEPSVHPPVTEALPLRREFHCLFAGRPVRIRTVGAELGRLTAASVAHLLVTTPGGAPPLLTIDLWDGNETGLPWRMMATRDGAGIDYWFALSADRRFVVQEQPHVLTWIDRKAGHVVGWTPDARQFNLSERARVAYFPVLLWMNDQGLRIVHAGLIAHGGRGALLPGESGQGKSTLALTCLHCGLDFLSDDHVWLEPAATSPDPAGATLAHGLYGSTNLAPDNFERFPRLGAGAIPPVNPMPGERKSLVFLHPLFPGQIKGSTPVRAIVMPRVVRSQSSRYTPAARGEALVMLARTVATDWKFKQMPDPAARFEAMARLTESVPCFWLEMGQELPDAARAVRELLQEHCD